MTEAQSGLVAEELFHSVIQQDVGRPSKVPLSASDLEQQTRLSKDPGVPSDRMKSFYTERLRGRKVQLANPDRPMPKTKAGSSQQRKQAERKSRVTKRWREALKAEAQRETSSFLSGKGKGKAKMDVVKPLSRKPKAKRMALEECRQMVR